MASISSEAVKKRGRPKKTISDPVEIEVLEGTKRTTSRAKSTKAAAKAVKAVPPTPAKSPVVKKPIVKRIGSSSPPSKVDSKPPAPPSGATQKPPPVAAKATVKKPVTIETSEILSKVRELSAKPVTPAADPANCSKSSSATSPKPSYPTPQPKGSSSPTTGSPNPPNPSTKPAPTSFKLAPSAAKSTLPPPSAKPKPNPHIPIAALNSEIVSKISTRAGARPIVPNKEFALRYKNVARKVTLAIVAMPVAIVTSWVLYERVVLGEDRKLLVKPGMAVVEAPPTAEAKTDSAPNPS